MTARFTRRGALAGGLALGACAQSEPTWSGAKNVPPPPDHPAFVEIERRIGGRLGVVAYKIGVNGGLTRRATEAFPMCSTFKWLLAVTQLGMAERGERRLDEPLPFDEADLLDHAPVAREHLARGSMSIEEACEAAVKMSDNTAANLLLEVQGGPEGFTQLLRAYNDNVTRLDRNEPGLNHVAPGDVRDTSTPAMMAVMLDSFLLRSTSPILATRDKLINWMVESPTGRTRLRAGFPSDWRVADKTGTWNGEFNATNDVAIAWPPDGRPIVIASYMHCSTVEPQARNAAHAEIARIVTEHWG